MVALGCGITILILGAALAVTVGYVGFVTVPSIIENTILDQVILKDNTTQIDRFRELPFALNFSVRIFNILNPNEVLNNAVPIVEEVGPYIYRLYRIRDETGADNETLSYRVVEDFVFDAEASFPYTEQDMVTIVNVPYHAVLQIAESQGSLMNTLNAASGGIFGAHNSPIATVAVRDLLFDGIPICQNPSGLISAVACIAVRSSAQGNANMRLDDTNTLWFSFLNYKAGIPSAEYVVDRGLSDPMDLARIRSFDNRSYLDYWKNPDALEEDTEDIEDEERPVSYCNMLNGTDSGVFHPLVETDDILRAFNPDICRSVELRYQYDVNYKGVHGHRFAMNDWFLTNDDGCFCLNETQGLLQPDGCLHQGALELYSCTGAYTVLTYPHFLYADSEYSNGVVGVTPQAENHRIFVDLEPHTGVVLRGAKRVQFNLFMRPVTAISATQNLRTTLAPILWIEEAMELPDHLIDEIDDRLLWPLRLIDGLRPALLALAALLLLLGVVLIIVGVRRRKRMNVTTTPETRPNKMTN